MKNLLLVLTLSSIMILPVQVMAATQSFTDVPPDHWCYDVIKDLTEQNLLSGYFDGTFKPDQPVTRAEVAAMLIRFAELPTTPVRDATYQDMTVTHWALPFAEAVKAYLPGYDLAGGGKIFEPSTPARREDVVAAAAKIQMGHPVVTNTAVLQQRFTDYHEISNQTRQAVSWAVHQGQVAGYPDGSFRPQSPVTRAEVAAFLYRSFVRGLSIVSLLSAGEIKPLSSTSPVYKELTEKLKKENSTLAFRSSPVWEPGYYAQSVSLYGGKGPEMLYIFINLNSDYFQWQGQWHPEAVKRLAEQVALEVSEAKQKQRVLVLVGHAFEFSDIKEPDRVFDRRYLSQTGGSNVWRLERFYAGAVAVDRTILEVWADDES